MIRIFDKDIKDEKDFEGNGLAVLTEAKDICVKQAINGDYELTFSLPLGDKWEYIQPENIAVLNHARFRIKVIDDTSITARAVYYDAAYTFLESFYDAEKQGDFTGATPQYILGQAFKDDSNPVSLLSEEELKPLGMEWVTDLTDLAEMSKITPIGVLKALMEQLDKHKIHNELYVDNYKIALVRRIGKDKPHIKIDTMHNAKSIKINRDTSQLITRLYPYGKDDLHIGTVNEQHPEAHYIESDNYAIWPRDGFMTFDEIKEPDDLYKAAWKQFNADEPDRIDVPKYSVVVEYLDTGNTDVQIGDTVTVVDRAFGTTSKQRVISTETYPYERQRNRFTVGNPPASISDIYNGLVSNYQTYQIHTNEKGELKTGWLEGLKANSRTEFKKKLDSNEKAGRMTMIHDYGDIWVNPDCTEQAMGIVGGVFALANGKDDNGDYKWSAFGDWKGFTADRIVAGTIMTNMVKLMGEGAKLTIDNNMITMKDSDGTEEDSDGTKRLKLGYDTDSGTYLFELYDKDGNKTMYFGDDGNLTMTGVFQTGSIGTARTVIDGNGIQSYNAVGEANGLFVNPGDALTSLSLYQKDKLMFEINAIQVGGIDLLQIGKDDLGILCVGNWTFDNGHNSGSFMTADGKKITVTGGLITEIS